MTWLPWVMFPLIGAGIGYLTNWVAIKMLFHPRERRFGMQGLIPRRQTELAERIGEVVGSELVHLDKMAEPLKQADLRPILDELIESALNKKVKEWQNIPLVGAFITEERIASIRNSIIDEVLQNQDALIDRMTAFAEEHVDISKVAREKISEFDLDRLEQVATHVARTEFRAIEIWGAVLGFVIGVVQVAMLFVVGDGSSL